MNMSELDEVQGLTPEMVRAWLPKNGWELRDSIGWWRYTKAEGSGAFTDPDIDANLYAVLGLAVGPIMRLSSQALLREINPRMRLGIPSEAARAAHPLAWVGRSAGDADGNNHNLMIGLWDGIVFRRGQRQAVHVHKWSFWPVDPEGNKVRWPTDDQGNMI